MSRLLNIVVEGPTEKEFVSNCIYPYLSSQGVTNVRTITIETSPGFKGGDIRYDARYKPNVIKLLHGTEDLLVTSLIDFYRLRKDFPKYYDAIKITDIEKKVTFLEKACFDDISDKRFIPYIQLHEFEGLLFCDRKGFDGIDNISNESRKELIQIIEQYPNPELINEGAATSPSKRLQRLIPQYVKPLHGPYIALENGFEKMMKKCPRFNNWIETLIKRIKE